MKVIKKIEEHSLRTDVWYYCPHCNTCLWGSTYFPYPMRSKCPICKRKIEWDELEYFKDIKAYAIDKDVVEWYLQRSLSKGIERATKAFRKKKGEVGKRNDKL